MKSNWEWSTFYTGMTGVGMNDEEARKVADKLFKKGCTTPELGDVIAAEWPGVDGLEEFAITLIRPDKDGIMCVFFGRDGVVGAEAISDLALQDGVWRMK